MTQKQAHFNKGKTSVQTNQQNQTITTNQNLLKASSALNSSQKATEASFASSKNPANDPILKQLTQKEDRVTGNISWKTFHSYVMTIGGYHQIVIMIVLAFDNHFLVMYAYNYLETWSQDFEHSPKYKNLSIYAAICFLSALGGVTRKMIEFALCYLLSIKMHNKMMRSLLHADLESFHDKIPYGQIQNRFSRDLSLMDKKGIRYMFYFLNSTVRAIVLFSTIGYSIGPEIFILVVLWLFYSTYIQISFMNAKREYRRLSAISKSPMIDCASDSIKGLVYLRSMEVTHYMKRKFTQAAECVLKNELMDNILTCWFSARTTFTQQLFIQLPCLLGILYYYTDLDSAKIGLFFLCTFDMQETISDMILDSTEFEASMVSVERSVFFTNLQPEKGYAGIEEEKSFIGLGGPKKMKKLEEFEKARDEFEKERRKLIESNPEGGEIDMTRFDKSTELACLESVVTRGEVIFEKVSARYMSSDENVLKRLDFKISPGEKIGVIGRTGSGKSSLIKLLWRYFEPCSGKIFIDGKNLSKVDIKALRNQITVITQETSLFEGTLRENLDPTQFRFSEQRLINILTTLDFSHPNYKKEGLDMQIDSEGNNLSQGERQLVCFARSILRPSRLVLLDEATASIDLKTEETIQTAIKQYFRKSTMIIVAHRVQTVLDCDKIMVLNQGEIADFDSPGALMKRDGFFNDIMKKMGEQ